MVNDLKIGAYKEQLRKNEINILLQEVMFEAKALKIPYSKNIHQDVIINERAKSRFGCCKKKKKAFNSTFEIEISKQLLVCEKKLIKQILAHELLHTCADCGNHGAKWRFYADKFNTAFGYDIKRTGSPEELGIKKETRSKELKEHYLLQCINCGAKIARTRMSPVVKNPSKYRCKCGGKLERIK